MRRPVRGGPALPFFGAGDHCPLACTAQPGSSLLSALQEPPKMKDMGLVAEAGKRVHARRKKAAAK